MTARWRLENEAEPSAGSGGLAMAGEWVLRSARSGSKAALWTYVVKVGSPIEPF